MGRLTDIGAERFSKTRTQPIERLISRSIAKRQNRERNFGSAGGLPRIGRRRRELPPAHVPSRDKNDRQESHRGNPQERRNCFARDSGGAASLGAAAPQFQIRQDLASR